MDGLEDFRFAVEGVGLVRACQIKSYNNLSFQKIQYFSQTVTQMEHTISINLNHKIVYFYGLDTCSQIYGFGYLVYINFKMKPLLHHD